MNINKLIVYLMVLLGLFSSIPVFAAGEGPMETLFYSRTTGGQAFETQKRKGFSGGSASYRLKYINENLVSFRAPSIKNSCNAIDIQLGSMSIIRDVSGLLQNSMRQIASGAASYAFDLALSSLCAQCHAHLKKLKTELDKWNQFFKDSCSAGESIAAFALGPQAKDRAETLSSYGDSIVGNVVDGFSEFTEKITGLDAAEAVESMTGDPTRLSGNIFYEAFDAANINSWSYNFSNDTWTYKEILMNLAGTYVRDSNANSAQQTDSNGNPLSKTEYKYLEPKITLTDLFIAQEHQSNGNVVTLKVWLCPGENRSGSGAVNSNAKCENPTESSVNWKPLSKLIYDVIVPSNGLDMLQRYIMRQPFNSDQEDFIKGSSQNIYLVISKMAQLKMNSLSGEYANVMASNAAYNYLTKFYMDTMKILNYLENAPSSLEDAQTQQLIKNAQVRLHREYTEISKREDYGRNGELLINSLTTYDDFKRRLDGKK